MKDKKTPSTNADRVRGMSDEELARLLCTADWCAACDQVRQDGTCHAMELGGPLNKYCVAGALNWLQRPAPEEGQGTEPASSAARDTPTL